MNQYYYISGNMGMTSSGSFSRDRSRWIIFSQNDINTLQNKKPYGSMKQGFIININKY